MSMFLPVKEKANTSALLTTRKEQSSCDILYTKKLQSDIENTIRATTM